MIKTEWVLPGQQEEGGRVRRRLKGAYGSCCLKVQEIFEAVEYVVSPAGTGRQETEKEVLDQGSALFIDELHNAKN